MLGPPSREPLLEGQKRFKYSSGIHIFDFVLMYFQLQFQHCHSRLISLEQLSDYLQTRGPARCHPRDGGRLEHLVTAALGKHRWQITRPHQENNNNNTFRDNAELRSQDYHYTVRVTITATLFVYHVHHHNQDRPLLYCFSPSMCYIITATATH